MNRHAASSAYQRPWDDEALTDIEMQPPMSTHLDHFSPSAIYDGPPSKRYRKYGIAFEDVSRRAQSATDPLFIPVFTGLRRTIVERLTKSLQRLEQELSTEIFDSEERVLEAVRLLKYMDHVIESEMRQARLEDPVYAESHGLSVIHFDLHDQMQAKLQRWLMVNKNWGEQSQTVVHPVDDVKLKKMLPDHSRNKLKRHAQVDDITELHPWIVRTKSMSEKQKWTLRYDADGSIHYQSKIYIVWNLVFVLAVAALVCFYGVGIIATNSHFSPTFVRYFFWVAIIWSLVSSALLSWVTIVMGASRRDAVGAFLTGLGLWLVVIQIGQTHLIGQISAGDASSNV